MSDINVQPVNLLKISTFHNAKSPGTAGKLFSGNKASIYYLDFYYLCLQA